MPKIKCIEDVVMINGDDKGRVAFTKNEIYRTYKYRLIDGWDIRQVICAKNNWDERHILKDPQGKPNDKFFENHFKLLS